MDLMDGMDKIDGRWTPQSSPILGPCRPFFSWGYIARCFVFIQPITA